MQDNYLWRRQIPLMPTISPLVRRQFPLIDADFPLLAQRFGLLRLCGLDKLFDTGEAGTNETFIQRNERKNAVTNEMFLLLLFFLYRHALFSAEAECAQQNLNIEVEMCLNACLSFISNHVFCIMKYILSFTDVVLLSYKPWDAISILIQYKLFLDFQCYLVS